MIKLLHKLYVSCTEAYWGHIYCFIYQNINFNLGNTNFIIGNTNFNFGNTDFIIGNINFNLGNSDFNI